MSEHEAELLRQAAEGDRDALAELLECCGPRVAARLQGQIGTQWQSMLAVDDIMQVTFLEAFLQFDRFQGGGHERMGGVAHKNRLPQSTGRRPRIAARKTSPTGKTLASRCGEDSYVSLAEQMGANTTTIASKAARHETRRILDAALQRLPEDYGTAIRLYDLEGLTGPEVARQMGRSRGAVHMLRSRGLAHLREILGSESNFFTFVR